MFLVWINNDFKPSMAFAQRFAMSESPSPSTSPQASPSTSEVASAFFSPRSRRQLSLFAAGATFFAVSTAITRRSLVRRYKATIPKYYQPSNRPNSDINGAVEAFEALSVATVNVLSVSMMVSGGLLWAFDISSLDDMRRRVRRGIGVNEARTAQDAEEEIEEWFATVLKRKEMKDTKKQAAKKESERVGDEKK